MRNTEREIFFGFFSGCMGYSFPSLEGRVSDDLFLRLFACCVKFFAIDLITLSLPSPLYGEGLYPLEVRKNLFFDIKKMLCGLISPKFGGFIFRQS